jgi:hypothetical protein
MATTHTPRITVLADCGRFIDKIRHDCGSRTFTIACGQFFLRARLLPLR